MSAPEGFPLPDPGFAPLAPLWEAATVGEFRLPRCRSCALFDWYPKGICRDCGGTDIVWERLSGRGTLFSWAVVHRALHPPLSALGPYVSAIVAIDEDPAVRFVTRIVDADPVTLTIDMPVRIRFVDAGYPAIETGIVAPLFVPEERP